MIFTAFLLQSPPFAGCQPQLEPAVLGHSQGKIMTGAALHLPQTASALLVVDLVDLEQAVTRRLALRCGSWSIDPAWLDYRFGPRWPGDLLALVVHGRVLSGAWPMSRDSPEMVHPGTTGPREGEACGRDCGLCQESMPGIWASLRHHHKKSSTQGLRAANQRRHASREWARLLLQSARQPGKTLNPKP